MTAESGPRTTDTVNADTGNQEGDRSPQEQTSRQVMIGALIVGGVLAGLLALLFGIASGRKFHAAGRKVRRLNTLDYMVRRQENKDLMMVVSALNRLLSG